MAEYIEREAALKSVCYDCSLNGNNPPCGIACADYERINSILAADVRENRTGRWNDDWETGCSTCPDCSVVFLWEDNKGVAAWNFCPNCGAKMEGN